MDRSDINLINEYFNVIKSNQTIFQNISFYAHKCNSDATDVLHNYFNRLQENNNLINQSNNQSNNEFNRNETRQRNREDETLENLLVELLTGTLNPTETNRTIPRRRNTTNTRYTRNTNYTSNNITGRNTINTTGTTATRTPVRTSYDFLNRDTEISHPNSLDSETFYEGEINTPATTNSATTNSATTSRSATNTVTRRLFPTRETSNITLNPENNTIEHNESQITNMTDLSRNTTVGRRRRRRPYTLMSATYYASPLPPATRTTTTTTNFDSPHRIRPTIRQINDSTELLNYTDISNNNQPHCPIDLNPFENDDSILRIIPCQHIFREMNLRNHFRYSPRCPICRYDIRDYENNENNQNNTASRVFV